MPNFQVTDQSSGLVGKRFHCSLFTICTDKCALDSHTSDIVPASKKLSC